MAFTDRAVPSSSWRRWYKERERGKMDGGRERRDKRSVTPLFSAHTKAAYYLILHATERKKKKGDRGGQREQDKQ